MKTKAILLVSVALLFCTFKPKAQTFTTGIYVGVTRTSVDLSNVGNSFINTINGNGIMGFEGGLFERLNVGAFFIKPMLLAGYQGGTATFTNTDGSFSSSKFNYGNIEIPFLLGVRFIKVLRFEIGPVYNWIYATHFDGDNSIQVNPSELGYRIGANIELGMINLGFAYQGLTSMVYTSSKATFSSPNELIFSVALCFGGESDNK